MNLQTERIDNHKAQLTIEFEEQQLDDAKRQAARRISRRVSIKGFRKGKAPYRLVEQRVGAAAILEDAVEILGDSLYRQALEESGLEPYGPGTLEDFSLEPPTLVFSLELQPEVDLKEYDSVRIDFEEPAVADEAVDSALEELRQREIEVLDAERQVVASGDRIRVDIDSEFVDDARDSDAADGAGDDDDADAADGAAGDDEDDADDADDDAVMDAADDDADDAADAGDDDDVDDSDAADDADDAGDAGDDAGDDARDDADTADDAGDDADDDDDAGDDADADDAAEGAAAPKKGDDFLRRQNMQLILDPEDEPIMPGFAAGLVGAELDSEVEFELTIPNEGFDALVTGRRVGFRVSIKNIEAIRIPELDDEFAKAVGESRSETGEPIETYDELRAAIRQDLEKRALAEAKQAYGEKVLTAVIEGAQVDYPAALLESHLDQMIADFGETLQKQGINLETYVRFRGISADDFRDESRGEAVKSLKRVLVLSELGEAMAVKIEDEQIDRQLDEMAFSFAGLRESPLRQTLDTPHVRRDIMGRLMFDEVMARLAAIGQGKDPDAAADELRTAAEAHWAETRALNEQMANQAAEADESAASETDPADDAPTVAEADQSAAPEAEEPAEN